MMGPPHQPLQMQDIPPPELPRLQTPADPRHGALQLPLSALLPVSTSSPSLSLHPSQRSGDVIASSSSSSHVPPSLTSSQQTHSSRRHYSHQSFERVGLGPAGSHPHTRSQSHLLPRSSLLNQHTGSGGGSGGGGGASGGTGGIAHALANSVNSSLAFQLRHQEKPSRDSGRLSRWPLVPASSPQHLFASEDIGTLLPNPAAAAASVDVNATLLDFKSRIDAAAHADDGSIATSSTLSAPTASMAPTTTGGPAIAASAIPAAALALSRRRSSVDTLRPSPSTQSFLSQDILNIERHRPANLARVERYLATHMTLLQLAEEADAADAPASTLAFAPASASPSAPVSHLRNRAELHTRALRMLAKDFTVYREVFDTCLDHIEAFMAAIAAAGIAPIPSSDSLAPHIASDSWPPYASGTMTSSSSTSTSVPIAASSSGTVTFGPVSKSASSSSLSETRLSHALLKSEERVMELEQQLANRIKENTDLSAKVAQLTLENKENEHRIEVGLQAERSRLTLGKALDRREARIKDLEDKQLRDETTILQLRRQVADLERQLLDVPDYSALSASFSGDFEDTTSTVASTGRESHRHGGKSARVQQSLRVAQQSIDTESRNDSVSDHDPLDVGESDEVPEEHEHDHDHETT